MAPSSRASTDNLTEAEITFDKFHAVKLVNDAVDKVRRAESKDRPELKRIIRTHHGSTIELAKWGFVREDWKNARIRPQNNARLETAGTKPVFASSFAGRHCLVLADSFYEWKTFANGTKQPYRIMLKSGEPFAMAGIYVRGRDHQLGELPPLIKEPGKMNFGAASSLVTTSSQRPT